MQNKKTKIEDYYALVNPNFVCCENMKLENTVNLTNSIVEDFVTSDNYGPLGFMVGNPTRKCIACETTHLVKEVK